MELYSEKNQVKKFSITSIVIMLVTYTLYYFVRNVMRVEGEINQAGVVMGIIIAIVSLTLFPLLILKIKYEKNSLTKGIDACFLLLSEGFIIMTVMALILVSKATVVIPFSAAYFVLSFYGKLAAQYQIVFRTTASVGLLFLVVTFLTKFFFFTLSFCDLNIGNVLMRSTVLIFSFALSSFPFLILDKISFLSSYPHRK